MPAPRRAATPAPEPVLAASALFAGVRPDDLAGFAGEGRVRRFRAGAFVFVHGEASEDVFCVVRGLVRVTSETAEGKTQLHAMLGPGGLFGEISVLSGVARTASVECVEDSDLWTVTGERFLAFLEAQPAVWRALLGALARQVVEHDDMVEDLLFLDLKGRVSKRLLLLAGVGPDAPRPAPDAVPTTRDISQADLAALCGGSRENVNRVLSELQRRGMVERRGRRYALTDVPALRRLAGT